MGYTFINAKKIETTSIRLCKWLKQLDSKLSPVKGFMGSNPLSLVDKRLLRIVAVKVLM